MTAAATRGAVRPPAADPLLAAGGAPPPTPPVGVDRLIGDRFGPIRGIVDFRMHRRLPASLVSVGADLANSLDPEGWYADRAAVGSAFDDREAARMAAVGEAVERYCGNHVPPGLRRASWRELAAEGTAALDPDELVLHSARQYATPGCPVVPFTRDLPVRWVPGQDMVGGEPTLLPAPLVYCNYYWGARGRTEARTNGVVYAGIAAGPDRAWAEGSALEELVERDATAIWWHSGSPATGIDVSASPVVQRAMVAGDGGDTVRYHVFLIPSASAAPVVGCLLEDTDLRIIGAGFACRWDTTTAVRKALAEAVGTWFWSVGVLEPDGAIWAAIRAGALDAKAYKPHRADRRYLDDVRPDFRDVIDLGGQMQVYLDPRMHTHAERMLAPPRTVPLADLPASDAPPERRRDLHLADVLARGFRAYSADVTTDDVRPTGLRAVRVIVPGLYTNAPAALPYLGGTRLYTEPATRGWLPAPIDEDDLVVAPIPHV